MADLPLYDKTGKSIGTVAVDEKVFGEKVRKKLLHQMVVIYEANKRQGTAKVKTRGEVEGSTKKPWPQKHTGQARAGTIRSPIWRHGGIVHGPRPRDYRLDASRSMKRAALDSAILGKIKDKEICVIESFDINPPKLTKQMMTLIAAIGLTRKTLIGIDKPQKNVLLSTRNLQHVSLLPVKEFNAYEVLKHKNVLLTKAALEAIVSERKAKS